LTPPGAAGDLMYRPLADRLVDVDLLADAAALLEHQIEFRLKGEAKARVGARLAEIWLMNGKPAAALDARRKSTVGTIPEQLADRRRHLEVHALSESGNLAGALAKLGDDRTEDAELLR